jgi:CBS domain-containing protein
MLVEDLMSTEVVTCSIDSSLQTGVERMLTNRVGSVIVHDDDVPVGIVTETDILHAGYVTERPFTDIPVQQVMSTPLITITPAKTLRRATRRMHEEEVKKLVAVDGIDLVGIITTQDIIHNYDELKADSTEMARPHQRRAFTSRKFHLEDD